jgi:imidazolonepropionase-like amidohydrolase
VKIAFGTDSGVSPHGENAKEFGYMVTNGMPPMEAIKTGTIHGATLLGREKDIGSVEAGNYADFVAVPGNPLEDIRLTENVSFVMKGGIVYRHETRQR